MEIIEENIGCMCGECAPGEQKMEESYKAGAFFTRLKMSRDDPEMAKALDDVKEADVVMVDGVYDHGHMVLQLAGIPFSRVTTNQVDNIELRPDQTVFVNCPGEVGPKGLRKLVTFVNDGGLLITTDWALRHVIEPGFPNTVRYNERSTKDEVVRINVLDPENPILDGFLEEGVDPLWWLEGSSYPIEVLDKDRVKVLVESKELKDRYGESPVIVEFEHGKGRVVHMISHFYLQRTETRTKKDMAPASGMVSEEELEAAPMEIKGAMEEISGAGFRAAQTSVSFISKSIASQKKKYSK